MAGDRCSKYAALLAITVVFAVIPLAGCGPPADVATTATTQEADSPTTAAPSVVMTSVGSTGSTLSRHDRIMKEQERSPAGYSTSSTISLDALFVQAWQDYKAICLLVSPGEFSRASLGSLLTTFRADLSAIDESRLSDAWYENLLVLDELARVYTDGYTILGQPVDGRGFVLVQRDGVNQFPGAKEMVDKYWIPFTEEWDPSTNQSHAIYIDGGFPMAIQRYADDVGSYIRRNLEDLLKRVG